MSITSSIKPLFYKFQNSINRQKYIIIPAMRPIGRARNYDVIQHEYIRSSSLELAAHEIYENKIEGSVAELGVWQGAFAKLLNAAFPDKKLYLFDTFEGFSAEDVEKDKESDLSHAKKSEFYDTSVELVMSKMPHPQNVIIKKGLFPKSLGDLEDKFCFVSLDADLYEPTFAGLEYFYPRLAQGGMLFIHDYNAAGFRGVKKAVKDYSKKERLRSFPLTDSGGTLVVIK